MLKLETNHVNEEFNNIRNAAGMLVLIYRLYGQKLDLSKLPIPKGSGFTDVMSYQPDPDGPSRYFKLRVDNEIYSSESWSVGMAVDGDVLFVAGCGRVNGDAEGGAPAMWEGM